MTPQIKNRIEQMRRGEVPEGYKRTKVGIVPEEWHVFSVGELYSERKESGDPKLPILSVSIHSGVSDGELDEEELGKKVKRIEDKTQYQIARAGDITFNMMRAWQGAIGVVRTDGLVSPAYIVAKPNQFVFPPYMDLLVKMPDMINKLHGKSYGVTDFRLRLYWDSFVKVDLCLPPLPEQEKIAEILAAQDRVIALLERKIELLQKLKKVFLQKMFPAKGQTVPAWRFKGFSGDWEQRQFVDLYDYASEGGTPSTNINDYYEGGTIPFVKIEDTVEKYITSPKSFITEEGMNHSSAWLIPAGNVIFTNGATVGNVAINKLPVTTKQGILGIIPSSKVSSEFLYYLLSGASFQKEVRSRIAIGTFATIILKSLNEIPVSLPLDAKEQDAISDVLSGIDNLITLHQRKCDAEKQKKKALMQLLLTGIVRTT